MPNTPSGFSRNNLNTCKQTLQGILIVVLESQGHIVAERNVQRDALRRLPVERSLPRVNGRVREHVFQTI
jgi:hypothetical protein